MLPYQNIEYIEKNTDKEFEKALSTYVKKIVMIANRQMYREQKRQFEVLSLTDMDEIAAETFECDRSIKQDSYSQKTTEIIQSLTPKQQAVFRMHFLLGYRPSDIAKLYHVSRTAVLRMITRIREQFLLYENELLEKRGHFYAQ